MNDLYLKPIDTAGRENESKRPLFSAHAILYVISVLFLLAGGIIPLMEMASRSPIPEGTFIEMLEWNAFSQMGAGCMAQSLFLFLLGLMVDRRGA